MQGKQICLVIVEIPIASTATGFNLYHILTFPVPFNDSSLHGTRVTNLPDDVAISTDERYIIETSASQMALCHGRHMVSCPDKFSYQALTEPSCAKAMFFKDRIQELCHFEFQESVIVPSVICDVDKPLSVMWTSPSRWVPVGNVDKSLSLSPCR